MARCWERANRKLLQTEGFLEDALAAALERPLVWDRLIAHLGLSDRLPGGAPQVSAQDSVDEGRTDIILLWPDGYRLALELKTFEPPGRGQIERYLNSGLDVIAIAKIPASIEVLTPPGRHFLGVVTWSRIRELDWEGAPLELRQLHQLLDVTGVVVHKINESALEGLLASWDTWDALQAWSRKGMEAAQAVLRRGGFNCVHQEKRRQRVKIDMTHQRLVWWMWPPPWRDDALAIYAGFFMGQPNASVTRPGMPDLMIALHVDPNSPRGALLRSDIALRSAIERWVSRPRLVVTREFQPEHGHWEILRCRSSSQEIAKAVDPGAHLIGWMEERAQEWVSDGIAERLSVLVAKAQVSG